MENNYIKLRKEREFGDVFNVSFAFIKQEYKGLGKVILLFVLPALLILSISVVLIQSRWLTSMGTDTRVFTPGVLPPHIFKPYLWLFINRIVRTTIIASAIYAYFKLYDERGAKGFGVSDVFHQIKKNIIPVFFSCIIVSLIIYFGYGFCILPGPFLGVSLSMFYAAFIIERKGFGDAFSRSFTLTFKQWGYTLLLLFVVYLMVIILGMIISLPKTAVSISKMFTNIMEGVNPYEEMTTVDIIISTIISLASTLLYVIPFIVIGFQYFNLVEKTDKTSLQQRISEIGKDE